MVGVTRVEIVFAKYDGGGYLTHGGDSLPTCAFEILVNKPAGQIARAVVRTRVW